MMCSPSLIGAVLLVVSLATIGCRGGDDRPTGVILISIDTLRADHLGCYGYDRPTSPFLDELADKGFRFDNAIVQIPGTLPSHMSMLTGLLPEEHGVLPPEGVLPDEIALLPEILAGVGIRTAGFTEGGYVSARFGFARGFEFFDDVSRKVNTDIEDVMERGLSFLDALDDEEPFFLFLHTYAIHDPYYPPPPYTAAYLPDADRSAMEGFERFSPDGLRLPATGSRPLVKERHLSTLEFIAVNLPPDAPLPTGPDLVNVNRGRSGPPNRETLDFYIALYDASINYVDDVLRSFFFRLAEIGLDRRTVVIITSDHGEEFFEHGRLAHEQVYHECLHVPLLVVGPGIGAGRSIENPVMSIDLAPTILELLGVPATSPVTGRSLAPALRHPQPDLEMRDAHAIGVVDPSEALYRRLDSDLHQVVAHERAAAEDVLWVEEAIDIESYGDTLRLDARSYNVRRTVEAVVDGATTLTVDIGPGWERVEIPLGGDDRKHLIQLRSETCDSPAVIEGGDDRRCLAFAVSGMPIRRTELFNVSSDPAGRNDLSILSPGTARTLIDGLAAFQRQPVAEIRSSPLDDETAQRLRELGYIE